MKPGAYTQIFIHLIFAVKYRDKLLKREIRPELFSYMSGIITNRRHKSIIINGMPDHIHILLGLHTDDKISDLVGCLKKESSKFINTNYGFRDKFHWQDGYGAFSYSKSQLENVYRYIQNQEMHHKVLTFKDEYSGLLKKYEIEYDEKYLFDFFE